MNQGSASILTCRGNVKTTMNSVRITVSDSLVRDEGKVIYKQNERNLILNFLTSSLKTNLIVYTELALLALACPGHVTTVMCPGKRRFLSPLPYTVHVFA